MFKNSLQPFAHSIVFNRMNEKSCLALFAFTLASCSGGGDDTPTGSISFSLMDRPVDSVSELHVTISEMWLKPTGGGPAFQLEMTESPLTVDLLELGEANASLLVDGAVVAAGSYNWVEMQIEDANIGESYAMTTTGGMVPVDVEVPSNRIRLVSGFDVGANQAVRILFDWDVRKGLTEAVGRDVLLLRPAFRILDASEYGSISGTISVETIQAICTDPNTPAGKVVYVFPGDVEPDDMDGVEPEPVTTVDASYDAGLGNWVYRAIVMPGDYTVAFTCEGDLDIDPPSSEDLAFVEPADPEAQAVNVTAALAVEDVDF